MSYSIKKTTDRKPSLTLAIISSCDPVSQCHHIIVEINIYKLKVIYDWRFYFKYQLELHNTEV